jgi:lysophospholipase L1-like esterase
VCTVAISLLEENEIQLKLKGKMEKKCEGKHKLEKKLCEEAVDKSVQAIVKKMRPEDMCAKMKMCDGFEQCQLFPEWPLKKLPDAPQSWPTERRQLWKLDDFGDLHALKDWMEDLIHKYIVPESDSSNGFYNYVNTLMALLQDLKGDDLEDDSDSKCKRTDIKCKGQEVVDHLPLYDGDQDRFSSSKHKTLRGSDWRGTDCDDKKDAVYPGRKASAEGVDVDHNCNGISGGNATASYEELFCSDSDQRGLIMLGDSATAHFHLPPQWLTANGWNTKGAKDDILNEVDFPQCSWGTAHVDDATKCPLQYPIPGLDDNTIVSLYTQMKERNRCMNNDFQNIGVNGARMVASDHLVKAVARDQGNDHPVLLWLSLLGNDVCNGHEGTDSMSTPDRYYDSAMESLTALDALLPPGSHIISPALFNGELLYDTMQDQQHPLGTTYPAFYDWLNCLQESPCWSWLNSDATARASGTQRAKELSEQLARIESEQAFKNFKFIYFPVDWNGLFQDYAKSGNSVTNLIEKSDGFHPSQTGNAVFALTFFKWLETNHPEALGPINPHNEEIDAMFFSK